MHRSPVELLSAGVCVRCRLSRWPSANVAYRRRSSCVAPLVYCRELAPRSSPPPVAVVRRVSHLFVTSSTTALRSRCPVGLLSLLLLILLHRLGATIRSASIVSTTLLLFSLAVPASSLSWRGRLSSRSVRRDLLITRTLSCSQPNTPTRTTTWRVHIALPSDVNGNSCGSRIRPKVAPSEILLGCPTRSCPDSGSRTPLVQSCFGYICSLRSGESRIFSLFLQRACVCACACVFDWLPLAQRFVELFIEDGIFAKFNISKGAK